MKRIGVITVLVYLFFILEFMLYNLFGAWGKPELLILLVVFFNLYLGIRFSLIAAVMCGLLKDSFSVVPFGTYLFIYVATAYWTTFIRQFFYQPGSRFSRALVAFFAVVGAFGVQVVLGLMDHELRIDEVVSFVLVPALITTMVSAAFVFHRLRDIAVRFALKS